MADTPRLLYNNDGSFMFQSAPPISPEEFVYETVGRVIGTQVDRAICNMFGYGDSVPFYLTEIPGARGPKNETYTSGQTYRHQENLHHIWSLDEDVWALAVQAAHDAGMEYWAGTRFNDRHGEAYAWLSEWRTSHPEYNIPDDCTAGVYGRQGGDRGSRALNYALPEVRAWKMGLMEEVCTRYDVDGFELDLMRAPLVSFPDIDEGREILAEFLADCRSVLDRVGEKRGRPLGFGVRIPGTPEMTHEMGMDLEKVLENRSLTYIAPSATWDTATDLPYDRFLEMARDKDCCVYACVSENVGPGTQYYPAYVPALRAAATNAWNQDVDGIYIFNYNHCPTTNIDQSEIFSQLGHLETLRYRSKRYAVAPIAHVVEVYDTGVIRPGFSEEAHGPGAMYSSFKHQLPVTLRDQPTGVGEVIHLLVYDDLKTAVERGMLKSVILEITVAGFSRDDVFEFKVNGDALPYPESPEVHLYGRYRMGPRWNGMQGNYALRFNLRSGDMLKWGWNELELTLRKRNPKLLYDFVVHDMFLDVEFHNLTMRG